MMREMTREGLETAAMCTPQWASVLKSYLDPSLSTKEKQVIDLHLVTCRKCRNSVSAELRRHRGGADSERDQEPPSAGTKK